MINQKNIRNFLIHCKKREISPQNRNLFLNAIKFYYRNVLKNKQKIEIQFAKKPKSLPICFIMKRNEQSFRLT